MRCAILLAAGRSRRMGSPKLLLPWGRTTVLRAVAEAFHGAGLESLVVVTGPQARALHDTLHGLPVQWAVNPDPESEMLQSVRCGLQAAPADVCTFLVSPADLPGLHAPLIRALLEAHQKRGAPITVPVWEGRRGHPLVFDAALKPEILASHDGVGLRGLLQTHANELFEWPAPDPSPCCDVDTPEDYRRWRDRLLQFRNSGRSAPDHPPT
ncbi:MAG: glycosyl transferase [Limisphaera sp.]|nr:MAG: glycosyl transferase [Limisphaera sp.]